VLKLCNVVRQRLDKRKDGQFLKKSSGLGGTGGRQLSPELRIHFGSYGFKKRNTVKFEPEAEIFSNTFRMIPSERNHQSSYMPRRQGN